MSGYISRSKAILIAHMIVTCLVAGAGLLAPVVQLDLANLVYPASTLVVASFAWILWSWFALRRTLFEPYALFMIAAFLFNGAQALLELLGMNPSGILQGKVSEEILTQSLYLVAISALCLHAGALVAFSRKSAPKRESDDPARQRATRLAGWILLAISFVPAIRLLKGSFDLVLDYGYLGLYKQQAAVPVVWALSALLVPAIIFLLAGSKSNRPTQVFCLATVGVYAGANLFLGARGAAVMSCVAVAWVFESTIRRIPRSLILVLTIAALIVFSLVRETRDMGGRYRMSLQSQVQTLYNLDNPVSSAIAEMGHTLVTVTHTVTLVPDVRPFDLGVSYLYAIVSVMPNLGWEVHPTVAHGLLCDWLIGIVDPVIANSGGGLGFSFIAEAYLNFGWYGGPLWLGVIGFFVATLFLAADGADPARQALVASFLSFFLVFARGESAIVARGLIWYAVAPFLLAKILTVRGRARKVRI